MPAADNGVAGVDPGTGLCRAGEDRVSSLGGVTDLSGVVALSGVIAISSGVSATSSISPFSEKHTIHLAVSSYTHYETSFFCVNASNNK